MTDWFRSITLLALSFVGVVVVTLGLAALIVPGRAAVSQDGGDGSADPSAAAAAPSPSDGTAGLGGDLSVTGDREATFRLRSENLDGSYALVGNEGRIVFAGQPVEITQLSFDGLEFFPDPGDCTVTPGDLDHDEGIGRAELSCPDLADIRDNGTIGIAGSVGLPVDVLVGRELPAQGGSVSVGGETWTFPQAVLITWQSPAIAGRSECNMQLVDEAQGVYLCFTYDESHRTGLIEVARDGEVVPVAEGACSVSRAEIGKPNPRDTTVELEIDCTAVEVPGLGTVAIYGRVIVDELGFPF